MKKLLLLPIFLCFLVMSACSSEDPIKEELETYLNDDLANIIGLETEAISAYDSVTGVNYTSDQLLYDVLLMDVIPTYQEFMNKLEAIRLESEELREVHEGYIEGVNTQYNAFTRIVTALEYQDRAIIEEANAMLDEARKLLRDFNYNIEKLTKEHGVEMKENFESETTGL
ncbi:hypothetical protein PZE06_15640 [Robertmurraya sp. DFI.2.37]|uniref:hypothetical protein n=1 Tax=Robertmurraya sp. DFI.2.37 TaxID=3031819 RepID=UPI001244A0D8|nr:hypothetical protein [Robertmurraya sp. DFI.2.37]MDF1509574.1 hypothetical protein [Robertmurraya sp. DFI.2.37]